MEIAEGFSFSKSDLPEGVPRGRFKEGEHTHKSKPNFNPNFHRILNPMPFLIPVFRLSLFF
jgi:hypothetical protein